MFTRCFDSSYLESCPSYKTVTICDRWKNYQTFCEDIKSLENYNKWLVNESPYHLDKDKKQPDIEYKVYSPETCLFITNSENTILSNVSKNSYEATSPSGSKYLFTNQREFAEAHGLERRGISSVISGTQLTHKGWKFIKL